jgi:hypothetical protein
MLEGIQSFFSRIHESRYSLLVYALSLLVAAGTILALAAMFQPEGKRLPDSQLYTRPECLRMESELHELRRDFDSLTGNGEGAYNAAQATMAGRLLAVYDKWLGECANGVRQDAYYEKVRIRHETYLAGAFAETVMTKEAEGRDALLRKDYDGARRALSVAADTQCRINETYPSAAQADVGRRVTLEKLQNQAVYEPLMTTFITLQAEAESAYDHFDFVNARTLYARLLREIESVQTEVPNAYFSFDEPRLTATHRLEESAARIRACDMDATLDGAARAVLAHDWTKAAALYARAQAIQKEIATNFPGSSVASPEVAVNLDRKRQNDLAGEYGEILDRLMPDIALALKKTDEGRLQRYMITAIEALGALEEKYPNASILRDETVERLKFLNGLRYGLIGIRQTITASLKPVPGNPEWSLLECEVWQLLYTRLMGTNPSLRRDDFLPVEGCTMEEAREFARRLSWIMAEDVRLPDVDTYRRLVTVSEIDFIRKYAWSSLTSPRKETMPVATSRRDDYGYFDLIGNVAEWVEAPHPSRATSYVVGGSVRDSPSRLAEIPAEEHNVDDRVRNAGFRVMIREGK